MAPFVGIPTVDFVMRRNSLSRFPTFLLAPPPSVALALPLRHEDTRSLSHLTLGRTLPLALLGLGHAFALKRAPFPSPWTCPFPSPALDLLWDTPPSPPGSGT